MIIYNQQLFSIYTIVTGLLLSKKKQPPDFPRMNMYKNNEFGSALSSFNIHIFN